MPPFVFVFATLLGYALRHVGSLAAWLDAMEELPEPSERVDRWSRFVAEVDRELAG